MSEGERRLAAIMYTDMVGYTTLGQRNESLSLALVDEQRKLIRPILSKYHGREIKTMGDAFLVEFPNALDAVRCAYDIQRTAREFNVPVPSDRRIHLRIGVHLGDVVESNGDISGDAVNLASRIYPLADDGGVCVTRPVYESVHNKFGTPFTGVGTRSLKNISEPMDVYKMEMPWERASTGEKVAFPANRIAILPFTSFSSDPDDAYFADGVTDEIISAAAGISGLSVISRTSIVGYKGTTKKVKEIGRELEVGSVLEGTFKKAGNRIRVTTQLIDVAEDKHLWAQNYDRNLDDVFEVQSDVAKQIAEALKVRILSPEKERIERKPTESSTAYALYLKGKYYLNKRGLEDLRKALEYFELSVHEDPDFALGYVGVSDSCGILRANWGVEPQAYLERAKALVDKALELDPGLAEARASRAMLLSDEYHAQQAEEEFRRAIEQKPSYATAHMWYFLLLQNQLRWDEAREQIEKALELDPLSPVTHLNHGAFYLWKRDYSKVIEPCRKAVELGFVPAHWVLALAYGWMRKFDDMKREYAAWVELSKDSVPLAQLYADVNSAYLIGDKAMVIRLLPELKAHFHDDRGPDAAVISGFCFYIGAREEGFEWLERSYSRKEFALGVIRVDPIFDEIRTDTRYLDLLKRLELD